jgi:hypothetical protein
LLSSTSQVCSISNFQMAVAVDMTPRWNGILSWFESHCWIRLTNPLLSIPQAIRRRLNLPEYVLTKSTFTKITPQLEILPLHFIAKNAKMLPSGWHAYNGNQASPSTQCLISERKALQAQTQTRVSPKPSLIFGPLNWIMQVISSCDTRQLESQNSDHSCHSVHQVRSGKINHSILKQSNSSKPAAAEMFESTYVPIWSTYRWNHDSSIHHDQHSQRTENRTSNQATPSYNRLTGLLLSSGEHCNCEDLRIDLSDVQCFRKTDPVWRAAAASWPAECKDARPYHAISNATEHQMTARSAQKIREVCWR